MRIAPAIELTDVQEAELTRLARSTRNSASLVRRAKIILLAAMGLQNKDIAEQSGVGRVAGRVVALADGDRQRASAPALPAINPGQSEIDASMLYRCVDGCLLDSSQRRP